MKFNRNTVCKVPQWKGEACAGSPAIGWRSVKPLASKKGGIAPPVLI
jgi:hypothetical protein